MNDEGEEYALLEIGDNRSDRTVMCKVTSSVHPESPTANVTATIDSYGMLIQAMDLSALFFLVEN